jgi:hypothetical protein
MSARRNVNVAWLINRESVIGGVTAWRKRKRGAMKSYQPGKAWQQAAG